MRCQCERSSASPVAIMIQQHGRWPSRNFEISGPYGWIGTFRTKWGAKRAIWRTVKEYQ